MKKNMATTTLFIILCIAYATTTAPLFADSGVYPATHPTVRLGKIPALQKLQKLGKPKPDAAAQASGAVVADVTIWLVDEDITEANLAKKLAAAIQVQADGKTARVQKLYLYNNKLTTLQPDIFKDLTNLQDLDFRSNQLTTIESGAFNGLTGLKELNLSSNQLKNLQPDIFNVLTSLKTLNLYDNQLKDLQPGIFNGLTSLKTLDLRLNKPPFTAQQKKDIRAQVKMVAPKARVIFKAEVGSVTGTA